MRAVGRPEAAGLLYTTFTAILEGTSIIDESGLQDIADRTITTLYANGYILTQTTMPVGKGRE